MLILISLLLRLSIVLAVYILLCTVILPSVLLFLLPFYYSTLRSIIPPSAVALSTVQLMHSYTVYASCVRFRILSACWIVHIYNLLLLENKTNCSWDALLCLHALSTLQNGLYLTLSIPYSTLKSFLAILCWLSL